MEQNTETDSPTIDAVPCSPAAERMRRSRKRRRDGLRCVTIELRETEVGVLSQKGFLKEDARNDLHAVREALHRFFDSTLNPPV
jgi:hypothetical protein